MQVSNIAGVDSLISVNGHSTGQADVSAVWSKKHQGGVTPEPASMFLLGSGLMALGAFVRRRKASKS
jgi:hypothetical protein